MFDNMDAGLDYLIGAGDTDCCVLSNASTTSTGGIVILIIDECFNGFTY